MSSEIETTPGRVADPVERATQEVKIDVRSGPCFVAPDHTLTAAATAASVVASSSPLELRIELPPVFAADSPREFSGEVQAGRI